MGVGRLVGGHGHVETTFWISGKRRKWHSPAVEVFLDPLALAGTVFLRSGGSYQRRLRTVCANQHATLALFIPL